MRTASEWIGVFQSRGERNKWRADKPNHHQCAKTLTPREKDKDGRSGWAHVGDNRPISPSIPLCTLSLPVLRGASIRRAAIRCGFLEPTRKIQCVARLLQETKRGASVSQVFVLSLSREPLSDDLLSREEADTPLPILSVTHRGLKLFETEKRLEVVRDYIETGRGRGYRLRDYTIDELRPMLRWLLSAGYVGEDFKDTALALLQSDG